MKEARGVIKNIENVRKKIEQLGGSFKNNYSFTDIIFLPISKKINLNKEYIRLRIYKVNNWPTKDIILVHKKTEWKEKSKFSKVLIKKEFNTRKYANDFINKNFKEKIKKGFEYFRKGWEYQLGKIKLFVEDIKGFKPTIEIEAKSEKDLKNLFKQLEITKKLSDSVPEIMRKLR